MSQFTNITGSKEVIKNKTKKLCNIIIIVATEEYIIGFFALLGIVWDCYAMKLMFYKKDIKT